MCDDPLPHHHHLPRSRRPSQAEYTCQALVQSCPCSPTCSWSCLQTSS